MANKKRTVEMYKKNLGTFHLTRKDILALEDIMRKHMVNHDEILRRHLKTNRKGNPEKTDRAEFHDVYVEVNTKWLGGRSIRLGFISLEVQMGAGYEYTFDSIKTVPDGLAIRYLNIVGMPGVFVRFSPLKTELIVRRADAGNEERKSMDIAIRRIESRLLKCSRYPINRLRMQ